VEERGPLDNLGVSTRTLLLSLLRKREPKALAKTPLTKRVFGLERENETLKKRIENTEVILDVKK